MKMIKTAFIGILLIGLVTFSIEVKVVNFPHEGSRPLPNAKWCTGIGPFPDPNAPLTPLRAHHPADPGHLYLTLFKIEGGVQVVNDGEISLSYVAYDFYNKAYSEVLTIDPDEEHYWNTENPCTLYLKDY